MLTLMRRVGEEIVIGDPRNPLGFLRVVSIRGDHVQLGFSFPREVEINRKELADQKARDAKSEVVPGTHAMPTRLEQLNKLHLADPNDPFITYGIALEQIKAEDFKTGIQWLDKTLSLDANYFYAYFQKAKALSQLGEEDQARAVLDVGMERAKKAGDAHALSEMSTLRESI